MVKALLVVVVSFGGVKRRVTEKVFEIFVRF